MNVTEINIKKFRHLNELTISLGERLTAIAGQNGTGKSTILGLIGHTCREKTGFKTFDNKKFATEYSEIFKFSFPEYDKDGQHNYEIIFSDGVSTSVTSYIRKQKNMRETLRLRVGKSSKGGGKIDFPVIYLGLKRLYPLAQERKVNTSNHSLSKDELQFFTKSHNKILLLQDNISSQEVKSSNKQFLAAKSEQYDAMGNSAGQDNIGQIITAIISFQRLKDYLGNEYNGGILLIDELDASMFPAAQEKLIEFLFQRSSKLELQVVFTTHSIEMIEILMASQYKHQSKVCYLHKARGTIEVAKESDLDTIIADLKAKVLKHKLEDTKIEVYLEDKEAEQFLKPLLTPELIKRTKIIDATFGAQLLITLANKRIPAFNRSIILLDGDQKSSLKKPRPSNVINLPGEDSPEIIIFNF